MLKRMIALLLMCLLLVSLFAGCGEAEPSASSQTGAPETDAPLTPEPSGETGASKPELHEGDPSKPEPADPIPVDPDPVEPESAQTEPAPAGDSGIHPMLFHVTDAAGREMYLFGTIHVGDERINTVLDKLTPWLDSCDALAVEFDMVAYEKLLMSDLQAQMAYYGPFVLTDGTTVSDHMPAELYEKAAALLKEAGLMPSLMKSYGLSMWAQLVEQAALMTRTDYDLEIGMDRTLIHHCYDKKIEVRDVESPELQINLLASFSDELCLLMIRDILDQLDAYGEQTDELYRTWLAGDYDALVRLLEGEYEDENPTEEEEALLAEYHEKMLGSRNPGMRDKALEWMDAGDKVFFAVGAAHLVGEDGLVELLRAEGCTVEQVVYSD